ncbi:hypothetical protein ACFFUZ_08400 [Kibdelosporangium philippinense]
MGQRVGREFVPFLAFTPENWQAPRGCVVAATVGWSRDLIPAVVRDQRELEWSNYTTLDE